MPEIPRVHKIVLISDDRSLGTRQNAIFHNVNLPQTFKRQAVVMVQSFIVLNNDSGNSTIRVYNVHVDGWHHANSYCSHNKGTTDIICTGIGYTGFTQHCTTNTVSGTVILDPSQLFTKTLNVILESPIDVAGFASWDRPWILTLLIYEKSDSEILA